MSLLPMLFSNWWEDLDRPHRLFDQNFGLPIEPEEILDRHPYTNSQLLVYRPNRHRRRYHPFLSLLRRESPRGVSSVEKDKNKFQVTLDVQQFSPEEINVKVVDNHVVVEAKHEEKEDEHGWISRQFVRKYMVPQQCDVDRVESKLSSDGVLTITAPKKEALLEKPGERTINIQYTGQPAVAAAEKSEANGVVDSNEQQQHKNQQQQQQQQRSKRSVKGQ